MTGTIREAVYLGSQIVYEFEIAQNIITVEIANPQEHIAFEPGEEVPRTFKEENLHLLPDEEKVQSGG